MFDNLTMEIFYYSVIPVAIISVITLIILIIAQTKKEDSYKYNYIIKTLLLIIIGLVLPLITGYTIWLIKRYINRDVLLSNIGYVIILVLLIIALVILLIIICKKLYKRFNNKYDKSKLNNDKRVS